MKTGLKVKSIRERQESEMGFSITRLGGKNDGEEFRMVEAQLSDGTKRWLFASNAREGLFKQVFAPWDFEHTELIDPHRR